MSFNNIIHHIESFVSRQIMETDGAPFVLRKLVVIKDDAWIDSYFAFRFNSGNARISANYTETNLDSVLKYDEFLSIRFRRSRCICTYVLCTHVILSHELYVVIITFRCFPKSKLLKACIKVDLISWGALNERQSIRQTCRSKSAKKRFSNNNSVIQSSIWARL